MFLPSTDRGIPALGCAESGREVAALIRSTESSIVTGPTLQLQPITSAPHSSIRGAKISGVEPSRQLDSSSSVTCATTGIRGSSSRAVKINIVNFVLQSVALQSNRVAPKGIGFNHLGPSLQIFMVNPANQVGLRNIQLVITAIDKDALRIKQRAH